MRPRYLELIHIAWQKKGCPSSRVIAERMNNALAHSTVNEVLKGRSEPTLKTVTLLAEFLCGDDHDAADEIISAMPTVPGEAKLTLNAEAAEIIAKAIRDGAWAIAEAIRGERND